MTLTHSLPLQQHPHFGAALRIMGREVQRIDLRGAAPVQAIRRFGFGFVPRGPVWLGGLSDDDKIKSLRATSIRLLNTNNPDDLPRPTGFRQIMTPVHTAELSLTGTQADRVVQMRGKWRNAYRKATATKLRFKRTMFEAPLHRWLLAADRTQQNAKGFRALPHELILAYSAASPSDVVVFTAKEKHETIAAMLFFCHAPVATYHLGWTNATGRRLSAHHALLMHAADCFADDGLTRLDIGTVDTENAPGLARFKIGCGAVVRPLGGTWLRMPGF